LGDRVAFITGAASGINRATALRFAAEGYGVAALDLNLTGAQQTAREINDGGGRALAVEVDVMNHGAMREAVGKAVTHFGRVDVLVSGAGYAKNAAFIDLEEDAWDRMIGVHLKGAYNAIQPVLPHMKERGFGRIVCISSTAAINGTVNHAHYAAAKAGILGLVRALAKEVGPWGITVNAVVPGAVQTPIIAGISEERFKMLSNTPVGRVGQPEDIAHAIRFLASDEAEYCTGTYLAVTGGL
jgi:NAD(P)-dependent dehydrogenase (short-subunit alcohol dehydrogenase family)